jgi:hypothetical protein
MAAMLDQVEYQDNIFRNKIRKLQEARYNFDTSFRKFKEYVRKYSVTVKDSEIPGLMSSFEIGEMPVDLSAYTNVIV